MCWGSWTERLSFSPMETRQRSRNSGEELQSINGMRHIVFFIFLFCSMGVCGQSSDFFQKLKAAYPDDMGVFLERSKSMTLLVKEDSLYSSATVSETLLFLKDQAHRSADWRVYGSYFDEIEDMEAKTRFLENGHYKEL